MRTFHLIAKWQFLFRKTINIIFMFFFASLIVKIFLKIFREDPQLLPCIIFGPKMAYLPQRRIFFRKTINIIFMHFFAPFIVENF